MRTAWTLALFLAGCTGAPLMIDGGEIRNRSGQDLYEVRAHFQPTNRMLFANAILAGSAFQLDFPPNEAKSDYVDLSWRLATGRRCEARVATPRQGSGDAAAPHRLHYSIHADGTATVEVVGGR